MYASRCHEHEDRLSGWQIVAVTCGCGGCQDSLYAPALRNGARVSDNADDP